jgi:uncharacterized membrane protein HdeD (DUF308 family)
LKQHLSAGLLEEDWIVTEVLNTKAFGTRFPAIGEKWGWFAALGIGELIIAGIASANLMAANLASTLIIGASMAAAGIFQIVHAFSVHGLRSFLFWLLAGIVYAAAGAIVLYDPALASFSLSLVVCACLIAARAVRMWAGFHVRPAAGWCWIVAAGALTFCAGIMLAAAWPAIGLWLLGAVLIVDLIFQGCGLIAFGFALKTRTSRYSAEAATV